jgi:hypothetical protein
MGMDATINGREIRYSGLLAAAGATIKPVEQGMVSFDVSEVTLMAFELANSIDKVKIGGYEIQYQDVLEVRSATDKLLSLLEWLNEAMSDASLTFA